MRPLFLVPLALLVVIEPTEAQSVRDHTRLKGNRTTVTEAQATELTLTLTEVAIRPIQVWVRTAGRLDDNGRRVLNAVVPAERATHVRVGQRVRAFSPESRSRMHQANVSEVVSRGGSVAVKATLTAPPLEQSRHYILEIVTEEIELLSVPNEAILNTGGRTMVYVKAADGSYEPREVMLGVQGELLTHIVGGLSAGEQVVTIGSFFIDADYKLKGP
jgi:Cu(I)/Ag(I) efflux system membrane fusion protein